MNTQSHVLMGALLFGRKIPKLAWIAALGGVIPDVPMFAIVGFLRATGHGFEEIFGKLYWSDWWQIANAIGHNFWIWGLIGVLGWQMTKSANALAAVRGQYTFALGGSALVHSIIDFLVHRNDAHMHFWPLTQWRFVSPVSYWDSAHYGTQFSLFEAGLGLLMAIFLFRQFENGLVRAALVILLVLYAAVPAFYIYNLGRA
jgi:hypothetical protein